MRYSRKTLSSMGGVLNEQAAGEGAHKIVSDSEQILLRTFLDALPALKPKQATKTTDGQKKATEMGSTIV